MSIKNKKFMKYVIENKLNMRQILDEDYRKQVESKEIEKES